MILTASTFPQYVAKPRGEPLPGRNGWIEPRFHRPGDRFEVIIAHGKLKKRAMVVGVASAPSKGFHDVKGRALARPLTESVFPLWERQGAEGAGCLVRLPA